MRKNHFLTLLLIFISASASLFAQQKISGKIINQQNEPVSGATITLDNSKKATLTSGDGSFEINSLANDKAIIVTNVGYTTVTISINGKSYFEIKLSANATLLEDFVIVGSRKAQRSKYNSIAPVDIVKLSDVQLQVPQIGIKGRNQLR